eukprot:TRINITY_DN3347_c0_g1_i3.p1 TRINITY_DN3347_c0_g1~~TRINITY_DN3347_c0_g1_i3.p1  ORF type:complete len:899 (-),score=261.60 TRINITY_DN3347_c0_g1_i3:246-2942(-)
MSSNDSEASSNSKPVHQNPKPKEEEEEKVGETNHPQHQQQQQEEERLLSPKPIQAIRSIAQKICSHPLQNSDPAVWAVLTAVSVSARKRPQGVNILLNADEHCFGRVVDDPCFQIEGTAVSANHCKIYRKKIEDAELTSTSICFFLKDTSTNGTYLNWNKLRKQSPEAKIKHGDIISFVTPPHNESSLAFVFREVNKSMCGTSLKRKSGDIGSESKRLKGLGIGSHEGPISLDDVRSLQRSNTELRKALESHVHTIETMRSENREAGLRHESELKQLKESVSLSYLEKLKELHLMLEVKQKQLVEVNTISSERQHAMEDLKERVSASIQSRVEADEIINSQKATISELEVRLDEERNLRKEEREKAAADLKAALQRAHTEAQEEIKRQADAASKQQKEQQEIISKLQESDKESRALLETLRSKLEHTRESFVTSEKKVRQLEAQLHEEQLATANGRKKVEIMESEVTRLRKELESEKVAREEAWAKVSALELEIAAAIRDLAIEKQRFQGARERIILRETQLRAFYSTTDEISSLFAKQQEQLKAMRKTLEDEENYENTSIDIDINAIKENLNGVLDKERNDRQRNITAREVSGMSTPKNIRTEGDNASDDASATEKHDCDLGSQEDGCTQDAECTSADPSVKGFGSYIGTEPVPDGDGDPIDTERVLGTESEAIDIGFSQHVVMHKCSNLAGDKMQLDNEEQENGEQPRTTDDEDGRCSRPKNQLEALIKAVEDTEPDTIRTADLLASEVAGSWAVSTAPSVHGENESPGSGAHTGANNDDETPVAGFSDGQAAASQNAPVIAAKRLSQERRALNAMIQIVAPEFKEQFENGGRDERMSDGDTEGSSGDNDEDDEDGDAGMGKDKIDAMSDAGSKDSSDDGNKDGDFEDQTQEDSVG